MSTLRDRSYVGFTSSTEDTIWFDKDSDLVQTKRTVPGISLHDPEIGTITMPLELLPKSIFRTESLSGLQLDKVVEHINKTIVAPNYGKQMEIPPLQLSNLIDKLPAEYIEQAERELFAKGLENEPKAVELDKPGQKLEHDEPIRITNSTIVAEDNNSTEFDSKTATYGFLIEQYAKTPPNIPPHEPQPILSSIRADYVRVVGDNIPNELSEYHTLKSNKIDSVAWVAQQTPELLEKIKQTLDKPFQSQPIIFNNQRLQSHELSQIYDKTLTNIEGSKLKQEQQPPRNKPRI